MVMLIADLNQTRRVLDDFNLTFNPQAGFLDISLSNSYQKTFVSGFEKELREVVLFHNSLQLRDFAKEKYGISSVTTNMPGAYHCRLLTPLKPIFEEEMRVRGFKFRTPKFRILRNCDTLPFTEANIVDGLVRSFDHTVLFYQSLKEAVKSIEQASSRSEISEHVMHFCDLGSKRFLSKCVIDLEAETGQSYKKESFDS